MSALFQILLFMFEFLFEIFGLNKPENGVEYAVIFIYPEGL